MHVQLFHPSVFIVYADGPLNEFRQQILADSIGTVTKYYIFNCLGLILSGSLLLNAKYTLCFENCHFKGQAMCLLLSHLRIIALSYKLFIWPELTPKGSAIGG